ncbi:MAG: succinyl-diaminopimelate desuccinylase [Alphaproteobacteria bacterium]|nr:succinyl-diaminopimelate desuccinylase [Alphaproteobacteria bacterium]
MSEINAVELAQRLIRRRSVTPADDGALDVLEETLDALGFAAKRLPFEEAGAERVDNLYARWGSGAPNLCFAGHTDVVPAGDESAWSLPPFSGEIRDGALWGRGAADMKGSIAAFVAAAQRAIEAKAVCGSISLLITGDEEGPAINGTRKVLGALREAGERIDHCLVGEPSGYEELGDMIKVGRRGSTNCVLTVYGRQGHVAYPHRAQNPIPAMLRMLSVLTDAPLDGGFDNFEPSRLEITDIHAGNPAHNVIPARAMARFNIRFNPNWTGPSLEAWLRSRLDEVAAATGVRYELMTHCTGDAFLTTDDVFLGVISDAIESRLGRKPAFSTTGGTSDARYIKDVAPVAEFGLVGKTIHQIDEHARLADIEALTDIYEDVIRRYFAAEAPR